MKGVAIEGKMKAYLFLAFFLLQLLSFKPVSAGVVEEVCGMVGDNYATVPCLDIFGSDPRSKTIKDIRDMALIGADISIDRAIKIQSYAKKLLENATDANTKLRVEVGYRIVTDTIKGLEFVKESLIAKVYPGANAVAYFSKYTMLSSDGFINILPQFGNHYLDIFIVLTAIIGHM